MGLECVCLVRVGLRQRCTVLQQCTREAGKDLNVGDSCDQRKENPGDISKYFLQMVGLDY